MTHQDEGRLMAYLDGELAAGDARAVEEHVERCTPCRDALAAVREGRAVVREALALADSPAPAGRVRAAVLARAGAVGSPPYAPPWPGRPGEPRSSGDPRRWAGARAAWAQRGRLAQAAVLVLLLAGGAAALVPGSPLRRWVTELAVSEAPAPAESVATTAEEPDPEVMVRVGSAGGRIRILLQELPTGTEVLVRLVEGDRAAVFAPQGARFSSGDGLLEAEVPRGPVRVEIPRAVAEVSLRIGDRIYLTARAGSVEVAAPTAERTGTEIQFRVH